MSPSFTVYEAEASLNWDGDMKVCFFLTVANKDIILGYIAMLASYSSTKSALVLPHIRVGVPYTDFKCVISQYSFSTWQDDWNGMVANKLHSVKPVLGDWQSSYRQCKKDEIVLSCLH